MTSRYDDLPYRGRAYPYAHPARLATVATLHGLTPPDIRTARVLEVGCSDAINLISMAYQYPNASFVGLDPASEAIDRGARHASSLGIGNLQLIEGVLERTDFDDNSFDYILAHGVFSWVSPQAQTALLELVGRCLTEEGVAYLSFNALPGWRLRSVARDLMLSVVDRRTSPEAQVAAARELLDAYAGALSSDTLHGALYQSVRDMLSGHPDAYWFHDILSPENHPYSITDFVGMAKPYGLQFLSEAEIGDSMVENYPDSFTPLLALETDRLRREQILDQLSDRAFRRVLLCRDAHAVTDAPSPESLSSLHLVALGQPDDGIDLRDGVDVTFIRPDGEHVVVENRLVKMALAFLCREQPRSVSYRSLWEYLLEAADTDLSQEIQIQFNTILLFLYGVQLVELQPVARSVRLQVSEKPRACRLARWDALQGEYPVMNALHSETAVTPFEQLLLVMCDGTREREAILQELECAVRSGDLRIEAPLEQQVTDDVIRDTLEHQLDNALSRLPSAGLLEIDERRGA